ncbi:MAG: hypothetical protein JWP75_1575, partial [Frondihabitans sp.]|nr:hypothetical protein [Frondihabitans sp.]
SSSHDGGFLAETIAETQSADGTSLPRRVALCIEELLADAHLSGSDVAGVGIGVAGAVDPSGGELELAPNLEGVRPSEIRAEIARTIAAPVFFDNDVNLAVLGEWVDGHARGLSDFVFIAVGTGIGMGIVAGGQVIVGTRHAAGEIGFLPFGADPFDEKSHVHGALEEVAAGDEIAARYRQSSGSDVTTRDVFDLAEQGDPAAAASLEIEAKNVALAIASVRAVLDPSLVVLGGGVGARPEMLARVTPWLLRLGCDDLDVRTSLLGSAASVRGAIEIASRQPDRREITNA